LRNSSARLFPKDTVLVAMYGATAGQVGILRFEATTNQAVCGILPNDKMIPEFLYYCFLLKKDELIAQAVGGAQPNISQIKIKNTLIPVPPLPEQHRIVTVLDEAFSVIAKANENAERNLANAREVFEAYLNSLFDSKHAGWVEKKLKEITVKIGSGATPRGGEKSYKEQGISLIRSLNVYDYGFKYKDLAFLDNIQAGRLDNVNVESGDVLLNITGASIARCCVVPEQVLPARVNQHVSIVRVQKGAVLPRFLHYEFISRAHKEKLLSTGEEGGATRQALTKGQLEEYIVSIPSDIFEQQSIIDQLDKLLNETTKLEFIYQQKFVDLEELKKSILEKAFAGELNSEKSSVV